MTAVSKHEFERKLTGSFVPADDSSVSLNAKRYFSAEFAEREWETVFGKTWLMGCHLDQVSEPGQFHVTEIGRKSIVITRGADNVLRAFHNVCRHRGNLLVRDRKQGRASSFSCSYHRWKWDNTGALADIPDRETFPGLPADCEMGLKEVRCDEWGGFLFFCLDPDAVSLAEYLYPITERIKQYHPERMRLVKHITVELQCNWKVAIDAFNEAYHIATVHPQLLAIAEDFHVHHECYERHSVFTLPWGITSQRSQKRSNRTSAPKALLEYANACIAGASTGTATEMKSADFPPEWIAEGFDPEKFEGTSEQVWRETQRKKRQRQDKVPHFPYGELTDDELTDGLNMMCFPNLQLNIDSEKIVIFRIRPFVDDPGKCYFDLMAVTHLPEGANVPLPPLEVGNADTDLGFVLHQDVLNLWSIQTGVESGAVEELYLSEQEVRVRHFHLVLDRYMSAHAAGSTGA